MRPLRSPQLAGHGSELLRQGRHPDRGLPGRPVAPAARPGRAAPVRLRQAMERRLGQRRLPRRFGRRWQGRPRQLGPRPDARRVDPHRPLLHRPARHGDGRQHQRRPGRGQARPVHPRHLCPGRYPARQPGRYHPPGPGRPVTGAEEGSAGPDGGRRRRGEDRRPDRRARAGQRADAPGGRPRGEHRRPFGQPHLPLRPDRAHRRSVPGPQRRRHPLCAPDHLARGACASRGRDATFSCGPGAQGGERLARRAGHYSPRYGLPCLYSASRFS